MKRHLLFVLLMAGMLAGCDNGPALTKHKVKTLTLSESEKELVERQNDFSMDLLKTMCATEEGNVFISPLSAACVCAMLANGAEGETQTEILKAIGAEGYSMSELNAHYLNLMENLPYQDATSYVALANAVYVDQGYPIEADFADAVRTHYLATVDSLELSDPTSADVINTWAAKHTENMVQKICDGNYFSDDLRLVLLNALCFKGKWEEQFKKSNTYDQTFHATTGDVTVDMMHAELKECQVNSGDYYSLEENKVLQRDAAVLRMYYKDKGYCMDVVLPKEDLVLADWLPTLSVNWVDSMIDSQFYAHAQVSFPKFTLTERYRLNEPMQSLGMMTVFGQEADLSGISKNSDLFLALLQQDTYIEVDEEGTKAAAVTSGWGWTKSEEPESVPFVVDRQFVFFIRDVKNGIILFAGRINNPKE